MTVNYQAICNCNKAECAGVAHSEDDARRAIAHFSRILGAEHSEHSMTVMIADKDGWMDELASARATIDDLRRELDEALTNHIEAVKNTDEARRWVDELEAERDTIRAELCFNRALVAKAGDDINRLLKDTLELEAERDAARALALRMRQERDEYALAHEQMPCGHPAAFIAAPAGCDPRCELCAVRAERDNLRQELADLRAIAQAALNEGDIWHNAAVYQQALEDIASEEQDDEAS